MHPTNESSNICHVWPLRWTPWWSVFFHLSSPLMQSSRVENIRVRIHPLNSCRHPNVILTANHNRHQLRIVLQRIYYFVLEYWFCLWIQCFTTKLLNPLSYSKSIESRVWLCLYAKCYRALLAQRRETSQSGHACLVGFPLWSDELAEWARLVMMALDKATNLASVLCFLRHKVSLACCPNTLLVYGTVINCNSMAVRPGTGHYSTI